MPSTFAVGFAGGVEGDASADAGDCGGVRWRDERNRLVGGGDGILESPEIGQSDRMGVQIERGSFLGLLAEAGGDGECFFRGSKIFIGMTGEDPGKVVGGLGEIRSCGPGFCHVLVDFP